MLWIFLYKYLLYLIYITIMINTLLRYAFIDLLVSARQAAYYSSCWLIVELEKLKTEYILTFNPRRPFRQASVVFSIAELYFFWKERSRMNHNNEILPSTIYLSNAYQISAFTKRKKNRYNSFNATLKNYVRVEEILEFAKFSCTGMHHICRTFSKLLTRQNLLIEISSYWM